MIPTTWFRCNRAFSRNACSDKTQIEWPSCCKASTFCIFRLRGSSWKRLVFAFPTTKIVVSLVTAACGFPPKADTKSCARFRENVSNLPVNTIFSPRNIVSPAFPLFTKTVPLVSNPFFSTILSLSEVVSQQDSNVYSYF